MLQPAKRIAALVLAISLATLGLGSYPHTTFAATDQELQQQVESATTSYNQAVERLAQVQEEIDQNQQKISQIEEKIPTQRTRAAKSLKTLYMMHASSQGLIELLLSSDDFFQFIDTIVYLEHIQEQNVTKLQDLSLLHDELSQTKHHLASLKVEAGYEVEVAQQAQDDAVAAREAARQQALEKAAAEAEEAKAALEEAAKKAEENETFISKSGRVTKVLAPSNTIAVVDDEKPAATESTQDVQEPATNEKATQTETPAQQPEEESTPETGDEVITVVSERDAFVDMWAPRIDAYLAGSPLGGYGTTFAEAAWDYGVDPRWSPAISCVESSKGAICFRPHNAWGWGNASWSDWDTAIRAHVSGLASGYGYTISVEAAKKYCPPTWQAWYSSCLAEMNSI